MKVQIVKAKEKKRRKPKREQFILLSRVLWDTPLGHLVSVNKASFVAKTYIEFRKYIKHMYRGCFALLKESKTHWILKRVKNEKVYSEKDKADRRRRFYLPQRAVRYRQMASGESGEWQGSHENGERDQGIHSSGTDI
jgi:hypothetical protein